MTDEPRLGHLVEPGGTSLLLGGFGLVRHLLPRYRVGRPLLKATPRPLPIPVRSS